MDADPLWRARWGQPLDDGQAAAVARYLEPLTPGELLLEVDGSTARGVYEWIAALRAAGIEPFP